MTKLSETFLRFSSICPRCKKLCRHLNLIICNALISYCWRHNSQIQKGLFGMISWSQGSDPMGVMGDHLHTGRCLCLLCVPVPVCLCVCLCTYVLCVLVLLCAVCLCKCVRLCACRCEISDNDSQSLCGMFSDRERFRNYWSDNLILMRQVVLTADSNINFRWKMEK